MLAVVYSDRVRLIASSTVIVGARSRIDRVFTIADIRGARALLYVRTVEHFDWKRRREMRRSLAKCIFIFFL